MPPTSQPRSDSSLNRSHQVGQQLFRRHPRRLPRAQAMVEFALALPIFLLVVYGLLEAGRLIFTIASVVNTSREAVRYASPDGLISSTSTTLNYQDCAGIRATAKKVGFLLGLQDSQIRIYWDGPSRSPVVYQTQYCTPGNTVDTSVSLQSGDRVWVYVTTNFTALLPLTPFSSRTITSGQFTDGSGHTFYGTARTFMGIIDLAPTPTPAS